MCVHFVPYLLPTNQKQRAVPTAEVVETTDDDRNVLKRLVTGNGSCCFMYGPETKRMSAVWLSPKKQKSHKVRTQK